MQTSYAEEYAKETFLEVLSAIYICCRSLNFLRVKEERGTPLHGPKRSKKPRPEWGLNIVGKGGGGFTQVLVVTQTILYVSF